MRIKEVAIGDTAVAIRSCKRGAAQHELVHHELAVVFAECALDRPVAGIGGVGAAGPLPHDSERVVEMPGARGYFPFNLCRKVLAAPPRECIRLEITDMEKGSGRFYRLKPRQGHAPP